MFFRNCDLDTFRTLTSSSCALCSLGALLPVTSTHFPLFPIFCGSKVVDLALVGPLNLWEPWGSIFFSPS